ncbi:unnamed protein product [Bursaphelenchus xylophilus]|uniref:(pine wood nematode) hypothetical protein n=1 Tax=Bursaphelenchus xylophilus TaxID=6326 RepID=A0A1I7SL41_BURXY|nr:unnamed protein product [Bursaphelenchus xylophilus]CAG9129360.1 unnamed protein product [Bursaphelenchus xylophilus]
MKFVLVLAVLCVGVAESYFFEDYPNARSLIPADIVAFVEKLRSDEVAAINAANKRHPGNIKAIIKDIEHTAPALAIKATPIVRKYQRIVKSFTPAGRKYADELLQSLSLIAVNPDDKRIQSTAQTLLAKWKALDKTTQAQLNAKFPNALAGLEKVAKEGPGSFRRPGVKPAANPVQSKGFLRDAPKAAARAAPNVRPNSAVAQG